MQSKMHVSTNLHEGAMAQKEVILATPQMKLAAKYWPVLAN